MKRLRRAVNWMPWGTLIASGSLALLMGGIAWLEDSPGALGSSRSWAPLMAILGATYGAIPGALFGFLSGLLGDPGKSPETITQKAAWLLALGSSLAMDSGWSSQEYIPVLRLLTLSSVPIGHFCLMFFSYLFLICGLMKAAYVVVRRLALRR